MATNNKRKKFDRDIVKMSGYFNGEGKDQTTAIIQEKDGTVFIHNKDFTQTIISKNRVPKEVYSFIKGLYKKELDKEVLDKELLEYTTFKEKEQIDSKEVTLEA